MRPISLELEYIGPFVKRTTVDLDRFGDNSLFLISGKTGSGKSFLFDSICYALFGSTPSGREGNMASDFRRTGDKPRIAFRFSLGDKTYEVERTLPYEDIKTRGGGTTIRGETQCLRMVLPDVEVLATKKNDVRERCEDLLNLKMEQFSRVMMIPQGEFRELLKADTKVREPLLQQLFRSHVFYDISMEIERYFKDARNLYLGKRQESEVIARQIAEGIPAGILSDEPALEELISYRDGLERELPLVKERHLEASKDYDRARDRTLWIGRSLSLKASKAELKEELEGQLRHGLSEMDPIRERLRLHDLSMELKPLVDRIDDRSRDAGIKERSIKDLEKGLSLWSAKLEECRESEKELPGLDLRLKTILSKELRISDLLEMAKEMESKESEMSVKKGSMDDRNRELDAIREKINVSKTELKAIQDRVLSMSDPIVNVSEATDRKRVLTDLVNVISERELLIPALAALRKRIEETADKVASSSEEYRRIADLRDGSISAELSAGLAPGEPCPVCGSREHPSPARPSEDHVSKEVLERSKARYEKAYSEHNALMVEVSKVETKISDLEKRIAQMGEEYPPLAGLDIPGLGMMRASIDRSMESEKARVGEISALQKRSVEENAVLQETLRKEGELAADLGSVKGSIQSLSREIEGLRNRIGSAREEVASLVPQDSKVPLKDMLEHIRSEKEGLPARMDSIRRSLDEAREQVARIGSSLRTETENLTRMREEVQRTKEDLDGHLAEKRFDVLSNIDGVRKSIIDPAELLSLKDRIISHDGRISSLKGKLDQIEQDLRKHLDGENIPDREDLDSHIALEGEKKNRLEQATHRLAECGKDLTDIDRALTHLEHSFLIGCCRQ